jgi:hypothetical protein
MRKNEQWRDLSNGQVTACNFVGGQSSPNLYSMDISYGRKTGLDSILSPEDFIKRRETMLHDMFPDSDLMPGIFSSLRFSICHAFANTSL